MQGTDAMSGQNRKIEPMNPQVTKVAFSVDEFCNAYGVRRNLAYDEMKAGRLKFRKAGRRTLIPKTDADTWLQERGTDRIDTLLKGPQWVPPDELISAKRSSKNIDMSSLVPSWVSTAEMFIAIIQNGPDDARKTAKRELLRMADLADLYVSLKTGC